MAAAAADPMPCKFWKPHERGGCRDGARCGYLHAEPSSTPCAYFAKGHCSRGQQCCYAHSAPAVAAPAGGPAAIAAQIAKGPQSCRGVGRLDLSPLGGDKHALKVFKEMLEREKKLCGDWVFFYHSYDSPALVYEVQAAVARVLFRFQSAYGSLPRLLKKPFEKLCDADALLKEFPKWPDEDHTPAFKKVGICCTTSLASEDPEATPTEVFLDGYEVTEITVAVLEKLLKDCGAGLGGGNVKRLARQVMEAAGRAGLPQFTRSHRTGHLLQIAVRRSVVDKWAYASHPFGVLDESRHPLSRHLAGSGEIVGQARLVANPSAFMRAGAVRLFVASADERFHGSRAAFQEELCSLLKPILGTPEVRKRAAAGVYGGRLPSWWRDVDDDADGGDGGDS